MTWRYALWRRTAAHLRSWEVRWTTWRVVARTLLDPRLWPWGRGHGQLGRDLRRWHTVTGQKVSLDHAFNEYLEVVYEHGVLGLVFLAAVVWIGVLGGGGGGFHAALVAWAVTMTGSITARTYPFPLLGLLLGVGALS